MHHLRCVDPWHILHAKGCDTPAGFDFKRLSGVVCEGGGNRDRRKRLADGNRKCRSDSSEFGKSDW